MHILLLGCVLAGTLGCGRLAFDEASTADAVDDANDVLRAGPCRRPPMLQPSATITGETFQYIDFMNNTMGLSSSSVEVFADDRMTSLGTTISSVTGDYSISVPLAGAPKPVVVAYSRGSFWTTWILSDRPLDGDVTGPNMSRWSFGDGPMWNDGSMGSVYSTLGAAVDMTKGFLAVHARDCAHGIIEGVSFEITPPPTTAGYLGSNGTPQMGATATIAPLAQFVAFNVEPGPTRIRATKAGLQFLDLDVEVLAGRNVTYTVVHAFD